MTAVVGILNKQAIALAADSAVTITGSASGRKILNKANKIFTLSKHHPVGIMIYNSASFMATPWETIIKVYRNHLGRKSFPTLKDYQEDFIEFIRSRNFYTDADMQAVFLERFVRGIINSVENKVEKKIIKENVGFADNSLVETHDLFIKLLNDQFDLLLRNWDSKTDFFNEFAGYTFELFESYSKPIFDRIQTMQIRFTQNEITIPQDIFLKIKRTIFGILRVKNDFSPFTGLIFCGFGEDEIYPQLIPVNISMVVDDRLRYYIDEESMASISNSQSGAIRPFAQKDVIDTLLSGIDPSLDNIYLNNFDFLFKRYNQRVLDIIGNANKLLLEQIKNLDTTPIVQDFNRMNQKIKNQKYIEPLMKAVSSLSKEDLAEMAESLIYLTYLKRRITFAEESVGGPVDVAVISKGDGFIWIKRKHYFKPELNQHFFSNYLKK